MWLFYFMFILHLAGMCHVSHVPGWYRSCIICTLLVEAVYPTCKAWVTFMASTMYLRYLVQSMYAVYLVGTDLVAHVPTRSKQCISCTWLVELLVSGWCGPYMICTCTWVVLSVYDMQLTSTGCLFHVNGCYRPFTLVVHDLHLMNLTHGTCHY